MVWTLDTPTLLFALVFIAPAAYMLGKNSKKSHARRPVRQPVQVQAHHREFYDWKHDNDKTA